MRSQAEFERVAMVHTRGLLRFARRLTGSAAGAEDLVQDALLRAWRNFHQFESGTNARAWLFRIVANTWFSSLRGVRLAQGVELTAARTPSDIHRALEINEAIDRLPVEQRSVIALAIVEGFTCRETAEILEIPVGTVMSRLSRGRQSLRQFLKTPEAVSATGEIDRL